MIKTAARMALHKLGGIQFLRLSNRRQFRVLMHHGFTDPRTNLLERVEAQCRHIQQHYRPVALADITEALRSKRPLPSNAVAVTVDDGYRDFLQAQAVFRKYGIRPTVFVVSDFLDGKMWLWWDVVTYVFEHTSAASVTLRLGPKGESVELSLKTAEDRKRAWDAFTEGVKQVENARRVELVATLPELLGVRLPERPPTEMAPLTWDEVRQLAAEGVEFGAHTKSHPILARLRNRQEIVEELGGSKRRIEEELRAPVLHFCYPNGRYTDLNQETVDVVRECGFHTATISEKGLNDLSADPYRLRRVGAAPLQPQEYFQESLAGLHTT